MRTFDFEHEISPRGFAGRLILRKAEQLANYPGFSRSDVDDIRRFERKFPDGAPEPGDEDAEID